MAARLPTEDSRRLPGLKAIIEALNGWIKTILSFRSFSMRGLEKARAELTLVCMAMNERRMAYL